MFNIVLIKINQRQQPQPGDPLPIEKQYTIATAATEPEALKKSQYYSALYQKKGLYHVLHKPTHIVTYQKA